MGLNILFFMGMMQASHSTEWPVTFHQMLFKVAVTFFCCILHAFISLDFASLFCPLNFAVQLNYWCDLSRGKHVYTFSNFVYLDISQCNNGLQLRLILEPCSDKHNHYGSQEKDMLKRKA